MDKIKIKRVKKNKKKVTVAEKLMAGLGVGATLMGGGMGGSAKPKPQTQVVRNMTKGNSSNNVFSKIWENTFGIPKAQAASIGGVNNNDSFTLINNGVFVNGTELGTISNGKVIPNVAIANSNGVITEMQTPPSAFPTLPDGSIAFPTFISGVLVATGQSDRQTYYLNDGQWEPEVTMISSYTPILPTLESSPTNSNPPPVVPMPSLPTSPAAGSTVINPAIGMNGIYTDGQSYYTMNQDGSYNKVGTVATVTEPADPVNYATATSSPPQGVPSDATEGLNGTWQNVDSNGQINIYDSSGNKIAYYTAANGWVPIDPTGAAYVNSIQGTTGTSAASAALLAQAQQLYSQVTQAGTDAANAAASAEDGEGTTDTLTAALNQITNDLNTASSASQTLNNLYQQANGDAATQATIQSYETQAGSIVSSINQELATIQGLQQAASSTQSSSNNQAGMQAAASAQSQLGIINNLVTDVNAKLAAAQAVSASGTSDPEESQSITDNYNAASEDAAQAETALQSIIADQGQVQGTSYQDQVAAVTASAQSAVNAINSAVVTIQGLSDSTVQSQSGAQALQDAQNQLETIQGLLSDAQQQQTSAQEVVDSGSTDPEELASIQGFFQQAQTDLTSAQNSFSSISADFMAAQNTSSQQSVTEIYNSVNGGNGLIEQINTLLGQIQQLQEQVNQNQSSTASVTSVSFDSSTLQVTAGGGPVAAVFTVSGNNPGDWVANPSGDLQVSVSGNVVTVMAPAGTEPQSYPIHLFSSSTPNASADLNVVVLAAQTSQAETAPPTVTLSGSASMTIDEYSQWEDPGATATDSLGENIGVQVSGSVNTNTPGSYTLTYTATDKDGQQSEPVTRVVQVVAGAASVSFTSPNLSIAAGSSGSASFNVVGNDPGGWVVAPSGELEVALSGNNEVTVTAPAGMPAGDYSVVLTSNTDSNLSATLNVSVTAVQAETAPPTIDLSGSASMTIDEYSQWEDPGATATDSLGENIEVQTSGSVDANTPGSYTLTYTATDKDGQSVSVSRVVAVIAGATSSSQAIDVSTLNSEMNGNPVTWTDNGNGTATGTDAYGGSYLYSPSAGYSTLTQPNNSTTTTATDEQNQNFEDLQSQISGSQPTIPQAPDIQSLVYDAESIDTGLQSPSDVIATWVTDSNTAITTWASGWEEQIGKTNLTAEQATSLSNQVADAVATAQTNLQTEIELLENNASYSQ